MLRANWALGSREDHTKMSSVRIGERYNNGVDNTVFNPRAKIECIVQCYNKHTTGKSFKQNFKICKTFKYYELNCCEC